MRARRLLLIAASVLAVLGGGGCAGTIPAVPPGARSQPPTAGGPGKPWIARDGTFELTAGGVQVAAAATVRRLENGQVRLGLNAADGRVLADLQTTADGIQADQLDAALQPMAKLLGLVLRQTWGTPSDEPKWVDGWVIGRWQEAERVYGGDPLLLRRVSAAGVDLAVEDYRWEVVGLVAHEARVAAAGVTLRLVLGPVGPLVPMPVQPRPGPATKPNLGGDRW